MVTFNLKYSEIEGLTRLDPEYYNPNYNDIVKKVRNLNSVKLSSILNIELGPAYSSKKIIKKGGIPISKIGDVTNKRDFTVWDSVDVNEFVKIGRRNIRQNEILMTLTGDPPDVGKVNMPFTDYENEDLTLAFNQRVAKLETKGINPFYLFSVLSTEYFRIRFEQCAFGIRQRNVSIPDLKSAFIYLAEPIEIEKIGKLTKEHFRLKTQSQTLYKQATDLLEQELGLDKINFEKPKSYTASFSEVASTRRMNAEYFSPLIKEILNQPFLNNSKPLSHLFQIVRGISPSAYFKEGIPVIKTKNIRLPEIDREKISDYVLSTKEFTTIQENDLLLASMGVGSLGRMSYIFELEQDFIVDGTIRVLRKREETPVNYEIPTLLFLSSKIGQELIYRGIVGSTGIISLPDEFLNKIPIPQFETNFSLKISELVKQSMIAKKQSHQLLADAKARVEQLIEEAANK